RRGFLRPIRRGLGAALDRGRASAAEAIDARARAALVGQNGGAVAAGGRAELDPIRRSEAVDDVAFGHLQRDADRRRCAGRGFRGLLRAGSRALAVGTDEIGGPGLPQRELLLVAGIAQPVWLQIGLRDEVDA